jgi:hypothetical protein
MKLIMKFSPHPCYLVPPRPKYSPQHEKYEQMYDTTKYPVKLQWRKEQASFHSQTTASHSLRCLFFID